MTSEVPNLHVSRNLNISKTKQNIEKLKTPLRLVWKCYSDALQIELTIFRGRGTSIFDKIEQNVNNNKSPQNYSVAVILTHC